MKKGCWSNWKLQASHLCHDPTNKCCEPTHLHLEDAAINTSHKTCAKALRLEQAPCYTHEPACLY